MTPQRLVVLKQVGSEALSPHLGGTLRSRSHYRCLAGSRDDPSAHARSAQECLWSLPGRIKRIEIIKLQNEIFYGNIVAEVDGREINVDSRPSDAIALSVRAHVPILVHHSVMEEAGIIPETDIPKRRKRPKTGGTRSRCRRKGPSVCLSSKISRETRIR